MQDNEDNNNIMIIFIELQVHNIFHPGGQVPYLAPPQWVSNVHASKVKSMINSLRAVLIDYDCVNYTHNNLKQ